MKLPFDPAKPIAGNNFSRFGPPKRLAISPSDKEKEQPREGKLPWFHWPTPNNYQQLLYKIEMQKLIKEHQGLVMDLYAVLD